MDFSIIPIRQLIPQRPPIMMVDRVLSCDETDAHTEFSVTDDNIFLDEGELTAPGVIENMAQSCAARMGCIDKLHGEPVKVGYIGDVRDAEIIRLPRSGETLNTYIHVIEDFDSLLLAEIRVQTGDQTIATARMKVAKTDIVADLSR